MNKTIRPKARQLLLGAAFVCSAAPSLADPSLCEDAALRAAQQTGVSLALLRAIMLAESGRDMGEGRAPWPWTLHAQGQGYWLDTPDEVLSRVEALIGAGETNIDVGCFQINLHWHGQAFPSVEAMLDPDVNASYAAKYLLDLYAQTGDWRSAAGAYHSREDERAETYVARLVAIHAETGGATLSSEPEPRPPEETGPILRTGGPIIALGSLSGPLIGGLR